MANDIKQKIVLEGEKEYNRALTDAKRNLKTLRSELKAETAELGANATAQQKNETRIKSLQKQIKEQEKIVKTYQEALKEVKEKYSDNEDAIAKWEVKLNDARTSLASMKNELEGVGQGFKSIESSADMATVASKSVADTFGKLSEVGDAISSSLEGAFTNLISFVRETVGYVWGEITDLAARSNGLVDLAGYWNTDVITIQKYKGAVAAASGSLEDLNSIVTKINAGDSKKITELVGVSKENYKDDWEYAMAVMSEMAKIQDKSKRNEIGFELFGKGATKAFDLLNDWETVLANLDKYDPTKGGYGLTEEQLQEMSQLYDQINNLKESWQQLRDMVTEGLFGKLSIDLVGNAQAILDAILKYVNAEDQGERDAAIQEIKTNITAMFTAISEAFAAGIEILRQVADDLQNSGDPVAQAIGDVLDKLADALDWITIEENWEKIKAVFEGLIGFWVAAKIGTAIANVAEFASNLATLKKGVSVFNPTGTGGGTGTGTPTVTTGGGAFSGLWTGVTNAATGAAANAASFITRMGGMAGVFGVIVDRVLNETNAGRGFVQNGFAGLFSGAKQDVEEKKAEIQRNASTFKEDWTNNVLLKSWLWNGQNFLDYWAGINQSLREAEQYAEEQAQLEMEALETKKNEPTEAWEFDESWGIDEIMEWVNNHSGNSGKSDGGNSGNTDGLTSADAKSMTDAVNKMPNAVANSVSRITVQMDGATVGHLVAPYVSREIAMGIS